MVNDIVEELFNPGRGAHAGVKRTLTVESGERKSGI